MILVTAIVLVLCGTVFVSTMDMRDQLQEKDAEIEELEEEIAAQEQLEEELEEESEYILTDDYVEEIARDKLGLVDDEDIVFQKEE